MHHTVRPTPCPHRVFASHLINFKLSLEGSSHSSLTDMKMMLNKGDMTFYKSPEESSQTGTWNAKAH